MRYPRTLSPASKKHTSFHLAGLAILGALILAATQENAIAQSVWIGTGGTVTSPNSGNWKTNENWSPTGAPNSGNTTSLTFGGSGLTAYTATNDFTGAGFIFSTITLNSTASVSETINGNGLRASNNGSQIIQSGSGAFTIANGIQSTQTGTMVFVQLQLQGNGTGRVTMSGVLNDHDTTHTLGLLKNGSSTYVLTNSNLYTSGTQVSGGTLLANNTAGSATGTGNVTVDNTGTLGGTGFIAVTTDLPGSITVSDTGIIAPGDGPNQIGALTLTATTVAFTETSRLLIDINATTSDVLHINGTLNLAGIGAQLLQFNPLATPTAASYTLATYTGVLGTFDTVGNLPDGYTLLYLPTELRLVMTAIPEPGTWIGGAFALAALAFMRFRKRPARAELISSN